MKVKYCIIVLFFALAFVSCATKNQQQSQEEGSVDTLIVEEDSFMPDVEYIESLIRKDLEKRNLMAGIDTSSSPLFYKTIHDDNVIILYRVIPRGSKTCVVMLEDENIAVQEDYVEYDNPCGKDWVGYEHNGSYEIINDTIVNVNFNEIWTNYCATCDSSNQEFTYHIKCTHRYKLVGLTWERITADTTIVIDERDLFCR